VIVVECPPYLNRSTAWVLPRLPESWVTEAEKAMKGNRGERPDYVGLPDGLGDGPIIKPAGRIIGSGELAMIRDEVISDLELEGFKLGVKVPGLKRKIWDRILGASLLERLGISLQQSADPGVWLYLTTHVFWDFPNWRYPRGNEDDDVPSRERIAGGNRNVLRKCWMRAAILGPDLCVGAAAPGTEYLGEDELVNLFERSTIGDNHALVRAAVLSIYRRQPKAANRMELTRDFSKALLRLTPSIHLNDLASADAFLDRLMLEATSD
jgi:hypothetical protein